MSTSGSESMGVHGLYYDGRSPRSVPVTLAREGAALSVRGAGVCVDWPLHQVELDARLGDTRRALRFADGSQVHSDDNDGLDALLSERARAERWRVRLEGAWAAALLAVVVVFVGGWLFVAYVLPPLADRVAQRIPPAAETVLGEQVLGILDRAHFEPTQLPGPRRDELAAAFGQLQEAGARGMPLRLEFRRAGMPNAFAVPGGTVVMTDELVELAGDDDELMAVLAHEIGHQRHRHVLRGMLQDSAVLVLLATLTGDVASMTALTSGLPTFLMRAGFSREFEREADAHAFELLRASGRSPRAFARIMRRF
ncbi:MAG TPA: M48 family metallopeptidase, partial [Xanthomonadaceae bacterium]|nr:M48 family metallopeptidase [Xanthomonadaceae bacterium]